MAEAGPHGFTNAPVPLIWWGTPDQPMWMVLVRVSDGVVQVDEGGCSWWPDIEVFDRLADDFEREGTDEIEPGVTWAYRTAGALMRETHPIDDPKCPRCGATDRSKPSLARAAPATYSRCRHPWHGRG